MMRGLQLSGLLAVFGVVSGCASPAPSVVYLSPDCPIVQRPTLPELNRGEIWDAMGDAGYREVERYINGVWAIVDQQDAILNMLCSPTPAHTPAS